MLIPWNYLKQCINISSKATISEIADELTYWGLESEVTKKEKGVYLSTSIPNNRKDLLSWYDLIREIAVLLNLTLNEILPFKQNQSLTLESFKNLKIDESLTNFLKFDLWLIKNINSNILLSRSNLIEEWLSINKKKINGSALDNVTELIKLKYGGDFFLLDYDNLKEKTKIRIWNDKKKILFSINGDENYEKKKELTINKTTKNIIVGHLFDNENIIPVDLYNKELSEENERMEIILLKTTEKTTSDKNISIDLVSIQKKIGQKLKKEEFEKSLNRLSFSFSFDDKTKDYNVDIPASRVDIITAQDLISEILKIYDYNKLTTEIVSEENVKKKWKDIECLIAESEIERKKRGIKDFLVGMGLQEILTYSLVSKKTIDDFDSWKIEKDEYYELLNPKNKDQKYYRRTAFDGHLSSIKNNISSQNKNLFFFEIAKVYGQNEKTENILTISATGNIINSPLHKLSNEVDFFWLKGILESLFFKQKIQNKISFVKNNHVDFLEREGSAIMMLEEIKIGIIGKTSSKITKNYQIDEPLWIAEISLDELWKQQKDNFAYRPLSYAPVSRRDISFFLPININYNEVIESIKKKNDKLLKEIEIIDVFRSEKLEKEKLLSLTLSLIFQSEKTLNKEEINESIERISENLETNWKAKIRTGQ